MTRKVTHQLTIRFDDALARKVDAVAREHGLSRNQAVIRLLRAATGLGSRRPGRFDKFFGGWTKQDVREFETSIAHLEKVDEETS